MYKETLRELGLFTLRKRRLIPNGRVCGRQHISSPSYGVEGQEAKELNSDLIQDKKNGFWHQALEA